MDLFTYLLGKKGQNTQRDLFSYLLGKGAGGSGTYVNFTGTSLNISNTLRARIKNIELKGATSQDGTPTPDTPIPIKVVTGDNSIVIQNQDNTQQQTYPINLNGNLLIKSTLINGKALAVEDGKTLYNASAFSVSEYIKIEQNTTYNISNASNNTATRVFYYDNNYNFLSTDRTVTTINSSTATYIRLQDNTTAFNDGYLIVKNGTVPVELAKIGNYQDYIYGTPNNWYKYKYIQKVVFDGVTNAFFGSGGTASDYWEYQRTGLVGGIGTSASVITSHFNQTTTSRAVILANGGLYLRFPKDIGIDVSTSTLLNTWLSTNNITIYYALNTPTDTPIIDTTLIGQLNNLYNATSAQGTTYITCSSASDSNEIIVFSGDIKVTSVGNSLNTSLLSSNIQEEPNLDDVNETEDIEQNEEPIEEEVS